MGCVSVTPALPLAVAGAGGHAMYPALGLPPAAIAATIEALSAHTTAFGVNFLIPLMDRASVDVAAERAPYVDFFLGEADPALVALVHGGGGVCGWQVESPDEARAAEAAGCDVGVAEGAEAGGRKRVDGPPPPGPPDEGLGAGSVPGIAPRGHAAGPGGPPGPPARAPR